VPDDEQAKPAPDHDPGIAGGNTARVYNFDVARLTVPCLKSQPLCGSTNSATTILPSMRRQLPVPPPLIAPDRDHRGVWFAEPSVRVDCPAYCGRGCTRTRAGSTTSRLPLSLLAWMRAISATSSASAALGRRSSWSRIMPRTFSRWRTTSSPKSRSSVVRTRSSLSASSRTSLSDAPGFVSRTDATSKPAARSRSTTMRDVLILQKPHHSAASTVSCCK